MQQSMYPTRWGLGLLFIFLLSCTKNIPIGPNLEIIENKEGESFCLMNTMNISNDNFISGVGSENNFWLNSPTGEPIIIRVKFLCGGTDFLRSTIKAYAKKWEEHANVNFRFVDSGPAEVRIHIAGNEKGTSSVKYIGFTHRHFVDRDNQYTMYLALSDYSSQSTISYHTLHEFGHILGLTHEQQNPDADRLWNKPYIYAYFKRKKGWTETKVDDYFFSSEIVLPIYSHMIQSQLCIISILKNFI